jgi:cytochrome c oxidase subunit III
VSDSSAIAHGGVQAAEHGHSPHLHHQFESVKQQADAGNLAMWLFILTEVMFFGGLFTVYMVYRNWYYRAFVAASHQLDWKLGAINSVLLITSSFTMALAVRNAQLRKKSALILFLVVTFVLGFVFLGIKGTEYKEKWEKHHFPGSHYSVQSFVNPSSDPVAVAAGDKPLPLDIARKTEVYFSLYFAMTGLHALHMLIGMGIILFMIFRARSDAYTTGNAAYVEYFGMYWHFVDIIWIFLFPLLYLINRH